MVRDPAEIKVCALLIEGTNCEMESAAAFAALGCTTEQVHLKQLLGEVAPERRRGLLDYDLLFIPGGFSAGDYIRAGAIFSARAKAGLGPQLATFIEQGRPVLGVCNGFQVLVELGALPGFDGALAEEPQAVLATNDSARYECRPTLLRYPGDSPCLFAGKLAAGRTLTLPAAHAEGKLLFPAATAEATYRRLLANGQVVFQYVDPEGDTTAKYPWNPNGSPHNIAGLCNPTGNVLGLMPHPERAFYRWQHSDWTRDPATDPEAPATGGCSSRPPWSGCVGGAPDWNFRHRLTQISQINV